jgi:hypothetical protein
MIYAALATATFVVALLLGLLVWAGIGISPLEGGIPIVLIVAAFAITLLVRFLARLTRRDR